MIAEENNPEILVLYPLKDAKSLKWTLNFEKKNRNVKPLFDNKKQTEECNLQPYQNELCLIYCMHTTMQYFYYVLTYFATAVIY